MGLGKNDLVKSAAKRSGYAQVVCKEVIEATFEAIFAELEGHGSVTIPNFGTFYVADRKGRVYHNTFTGKDSHIETRKYPKFRAADKLREHVSEKVFFRNKEF